jgi:hypothetical protein
MNHSLIPTTTIGRELTPFYTKTDPTQIKSVVKRKEKKKGGW